MLSADKPEAGFSPYRNTHLSRYDVGPETWWHMQLKKFRYFLVLCDELHFTRAAKRCLISQPSLTNAIRCLEQEFGGPLFVRRPDVRLTTLGKAVRAHCKNICHELEKLRATAARATLR